MQCLIVKLCLVDIDQSVPGCKVSSYGAFVNSAEHALLCALMRLKPLIHALDGSKRQR
jgi:hypothetical protein